MDKACVTKLIRSFYNNEHVVHLSKMKRGECTTRDLLVFAEHVVDVHVIYVSKYNVCVRQGEFYLDHVKFIKPHELHDNVIGRSDKFVVIFDEFNINDYYDIDLNMVHCYASMVVYAYQSIEMRFGDVYQCIDINDKSFESRVKLLDYDVQTNGRDALEFIDYYISNRVIVTNEFGWNLSYQYLDKIVFPEHLVNMLSEDNIVTEPNIFLIEAWTMNEEQIKHVESVLRHYHEKRIEFVEDEKTKNFYVFVDNYTEKN